MADPNVYTAPSYSDLITQQQQLKDQYAAIQSQIASAQAGYGANHFGGMSGDQFAAYIASLQTKLNPIQSQMDTINAQVQAAQQSQQLQQQRTSQLAQLQQLQGNLINQLPGIESTANQGLVSQEQYAMQRLQPQIEQRLNALGLLQSGALPEAQAKYQGDLDQQRQAALQNFDLQQRQALQLQMPKDITNFDITGQSQQLQNTFDFNNAAFQRQLSSEDALSQMQMEQAMQAQALSEARAAQQQQQQQSLIGLGGTLGGALIGSLGGPLGAYLGSQLGGGLSTYAQEQMNSNPYYGSPSTGAVGVGGRQYGYQPYIQR